MPADTAEKSPASESGKGSAKGSEVVKGLKGIKAADSAISSVDGAIGQLLYRGYDIDELAEHSSFEEVAYLLFKGELPTAAELDEFDDPLTHEASLTPQVTEFLKGCPHGVPPMAVLRSGVSVAGLYDPNAEDNSVDGAYRTCIRLTAKVATMTAAIHRLRTDREPVAPIPDRSFAWNFVHMIKGSDPTPDEVKAMDLILILHAEHGFNASTFAARVIVATLPDVYSAVTGAVGALKGKLHGGANTAVLETLQTIGSVENVSDYVRKTRAAKGKFMGFGHAVYQVEDPRAKHLKRLSKALGEEQGEPKWYAMSEAMENEVVPLIGRECNVDFYSASVQHYLGIPKDLFTCIFASSRIAGWCAHILEQLADNKIIRPSANYTGPAARKYVPVGGR